MTTTAQNIATKFNVLESAVVRIEEWSSVLFCVVKGLGARFVSKKMKIEDAMNEVEKLESIGGKVWKECRVYFTDDLLFECYGLEIDRYKTGNIYSAKLDGNSISNTEGKRIMQKIYDMKFFFDIENSCYNYRCHESIAKEIIANINKKAGI